MEKILQKELSRVALDYVRNYLCNSFFSSSLKVMNIFSKDDIITNIVACGAFFDENLQRWKTAWADS